MSNICPMCTHRVSDWQMMCGKAIQINGLIYHISCVGDITIKQVSESQLQALVKEKK